MIDHQTSEPASLPHPPPIGRVGSEESRRRRFGRWLSDPAGRSSSSPARREPFDRLKFWTVRHQLRDRLAPYGATDCPSIFHGATWSTLRFWQLLLDEDDEALITFMGLETEIPDPDVWFGRVKA